MAHNNIIKTTQEIIPVIYAYTTPEIARHDGWTKIGDTGRSAGKRIDEQAFTVDVQYNLEWELNAVYEGTNETFRDHDFHAYLQKQGIERGKGTNYLGKTVENEWFHIKPTDAKLMLYDFRADKGVLKALGAIPHTLRDEQMDAVEQTKNYFDAHDGKKPEFLWNAKPRFGKTLTAYDLCMALDAKNILIVTNRPAIANSWYSDYATFFGPESGYYFVSDTDNLKNKNGVITREQCIEVMRKDPNYKGCIVFISLQDLKGSIYFGGHYDKLEWLVNEYTDVYGKKHHGLDFDVLIIDEAHEGVDTYKTDNAFNNISRKYTLHLSGTPFKALANDKFDSDAIYNWTYADEQKAKRDWNDEDRSNPYTSLPKLNLLTYRLSDLVLAKMAQGADFDGDGDNEAYAFDLNEFFKTKSNGDFVHDSDVNAFLDALTTQEKFPFSDEYRGELNHTLWLLKYVASAKAMYKKLKSHPIFKNYEIVLAAGDGKIEYTDDCDIDMITQIDKDAKTSFDKVRKAIAEHDKTITLSVGQLTTGITIPEWTGVMMLSNMQSPALYMQAAFRSQNPCEFHVDGKVFRKENAYVFDFDPARTLDIFEQFANGLYPATASGKGDSDTRKQHVRELLNFFPVYGEDENGDMIELDAEAVLSIPRAIHAKEVVRKGFMCNFLFQNISGIFSAPTIVKDIINKFEPIKEPSPINEQTKDELDLNEENMVEVSEQAIAMAAQQVFGQKVYAEIEQELQESVAQAIADNQSAEKQDDTLEKIKEALNEHVTKELTKTARENYGQDMTRATQAEVTRDINQKASQEIEHHYGQYSVRQHVIELERQKAVEQAEAEGRYEEIEQINQKAKQQNAANDQQFKDGMNKSIHTIVEEAGNIIVTAIEQDKKEKAKKEIEDNIRDHVRGFARTIPSFLMGYGDENTTLANFDKIIPPDVFLEVTGITIDKFIFLRDGGDYPDPEDANTIKHFHGKLFDEVVFNDAVNEFLRKRDALADYFQDGVKEDIFDYIPPQKTNQIFTPKKVVKQMVDYLEQENPGCFDDPYHTFIDPYMKSGLYITEIVKRLYNSKGMKKEIPDDIERLKHIFEYQVYGLAPTKIIYAIAMHYIFGFTKLHGIDIKTNHFKQFDALPEAQHGNLAKKLDELFAEG